MQSYSKMEFPPAYSGADGAKRLAEYLDRAISAVESVVSQRSERWEQNRAFYMNEDAGSMDTPFPGASSGHYNMTQPKADTAASYILNLVTSESPYCEAVIYGDPGSEDVIEGIIQHFCNDFGFDGAFHQCLINAFLFNMGIMWQHSTLAEISTEDGKIEVREPYNIEFSVIEPEDFVCYPVTVTSVEKASIVGHRFSRTIEEIKDLQKSGQYIKDVKISATSEIQDIKGFESIPYYGAPPVEHSAKDDHDRVSLYYLVFKSKDSKGKTAKYVCTYAPADKIVLSCHRYRMETCCYQVYRLKRTSAKEGMYSGSSKCQDMKQNQLDANKLRNQLNTAIDWSFSGALFTDGWLGESQATRYSPGEIKSIPAAQQLVPFSPKVDISAISYAMEVNERHADTVTSINATMQGQADPDADTATEINFLATGSKAGLDTVIQIATESLTKSWLHLKELVAVEIGEWYPFYGSRLNMPKEDVAMLGERCSFQPRIRSTAGTPQMKLAALNQVAGLVGAFGPATGIDVYALTTKNLKSLEQIGGLNLEDLQGGGAGGNLAGGMAQMVPGQTNSVNPLPNDPAAGGTLPLPGAMPY